MAETTLETKSRLTAQELLANLIQRSDENGERADSAPEQLAGLEANTWLPGIIPQPILTVRVTKATTTTLLIDCPSDKRIIIFDFMSSTEAANNVRLQDSAGVSVLAAHSHAAAGTLHYKSRGIIFQLGQSIYYAFSAATNAELSVNYALIP